MRARFEFTAVLVLALAGCGSTGKSAKSRSESESAGGGFKAETFKIEGENPLAAELTAVGTVKGRKITARITFTNPGTRMLSFKRRNTELVYKGKKLYARDLGWTGREEDIDLAPGQSKKKYWAFHTEEDPVPGSYDLVISGIVVHGEGGTTPLGQDLVVKIAVP
jgi:hypothetical protein